MTTVDAKDWSKLNMWRHPGGGLAVRPGLRRIFTPGMGQTIVGAFSIKNSFVDEVAHYVVTTHATNGVHLFILDENFDTFQDFKWASDGEPRVVTYASVEGQLLVCSPDLPPLFGMVGSSVEFAKSVASDNTTTTAINPPSGITISFCNRAVTALGRSLFFTDPVSSDGGDLRTVVGFNQNQRPGVIYGLHEGAGGMLVAVTSDGTYGLDANAVAVQIVGSNGTPWRLLSHVSAHSYGSSCIYRGRIYVLTENGWTFADTETTQEVQLSDETMPRRHGALISLPDYKRCRMFAADAGPIVAAPQVGALYRADLATGLSSWWRDQTAAPGDLRGILRDHDGGELLAFTDGVYLEVGDFDGQVALSGAPSAPVVKGMLYGAVPSSPAQSLRTVHVHVAAAVDGDALIYASVRGNNKAGATPRADANGVAIGADWGSTTPWWTTTPIGSNRFSTPDVAVSDDLTLEVGASSCLTRVSPIIDVDFSESAARAATSKS